MLLKDVGMATRRRRLSIDLCGDLKENPYQVGWFVCLFFFLFQNFLFFMYIYIYIYLLLICDPFLYEFIGIMQLVQDSAPGKCH